MDKFLVITCGNQTKKIRVENGLNLELIHNVIKHRFDISKESYNLKYFDCDVTEWIDLEEENIRDLNGQNIVKIRVEKICIQDTDSTLPFEKKTVNLQPSEPKLVTELHLPSACISNTSTDNTHPTTTSSQNVADACSSSSVQPSKRKKFPKMYTVPKESIPKDVVDKMTGGMRLGITDRKRLFDAIYADVTKYEGGLYPTSDMYESILDSLVTTFPKLLSSTDLPDNSARRYWKDRILDKFCNSRRRIDKAEPEVLSRKRKKPEKEIPNLQTTLTWGLKNFLPQMPASEDKKSLEIHVNWLQREFLKSEADTDQVNVDIKMNLTFASRRADVVTEKLSLKDLLIKYPWMHKRRQILLEFERLKPNTKQTEIEILLTEGLSKYRKAIVRLLGKKTLPKILDDVQKACDLCRTEGQRKYAEECLALIGLGLLLKEKPEKMITNKSNGETINLIVKKEILSMEEDAFDLVVDDITLFSCSSFFELFSGFISSIYTFNLAYPAHVEKMMIFIQNVILELKDEGKIEKKILTVLSAINSELRKE